MSDTLSEDRTLDIQIAERLFGHMLDYEFADTMGAPCVPALRDQYDEWGMLPHYASDWNEIKPIAAALRARGCVLSINQSADGYGARFRRDWETGAVSGDRFSVISYDADMAKAVCLAALKALEGTPRSAKEAVC